LTNGPGGATLNGYFPSEALIPMRKFLDGRFEWRSPEALLILMAVAMPLSFSTWQALLNNFAVENAGFNGVDIGFLQSWREVPGFLSFTVVWVMLLMRQEALTVASLLLLGVGTAITGLFPSFWGLMMTTMVM
jgi:hypothetical protein